MAVPHYGAKPDNLDGVQYQNRRYSEEEIPSIRSIRANLFQGYTKVYTQEKESCTADALCAAYNMSLINQFGSTQGFKPSRMFLYYNSRVRDARESGVDVDDGASLCNALMAFNCDGVCDEEEWPYSRGFNEQPPRRCYDDARKNWLCEYYRLDQDINHINHINQLRACLLTDKCPFVFAFHVYENFDSVANQPYRMPRPMGQWRGRHAVVAVGCDDANRLITVLNSWGPAWADGGYFYVPYDIIQDRSICSDFWKISFACREGMPGPENPTPCDGASGCKKVGN